MKKLLSVFAAAAMLFSFASCSGDLHDDVYKVIDLSGGAVPGDWASPANWDNTTAWTTVDKASNTYTFDFETKADLDGDVGFKIVTVSGEWNVDGYTEFKVPVDGSVTAEMKTGAAMGGAGNAFVTGCKAGGKYTMTVVSNPDTTITVSVVASEGGAAPAAPVPYVLSGLFIKGDMNGWANGVANALMTFTTAMNGEVEYQYDFVGNGNDMGFKVASANWNDGYSGAEITVNADYVPFTQMRVGGKVTDMEGNPIPDPSKPGENLGDTGNSTIKATKDGANYRMYIKTNPDKEVFVKVEQIAAVTYKFKVINLGDNAQAWINGSFWGGWELGWPIASWNSAVKAGYEPVAVVDGVAEFPAVFDVSAVAKVGETKSFNFKAIACADDAWGQADWDSGDLACDIEITGDGTYVVVVDAETNEVSIE